MERQVCRGDFLLPPLWFFQTLRNAFCDSRKLCIKRETGRTRNGQALRLLEFNIRCTSAPLTKSTLLFDSNLLGLETACSLQLWMITFPYPPPKKTWVYDSRRLNGTVTLTILGLVWCSPDNSPIRSSRSDGLVEIGCRLLTVLGFPGNVSVHVRRLESERDYTLPTICPGTDPTISSQTLMFRLNFRPSQGELVDNQWTVQIRGMLFGELNALNVTQADGFSLAENTIVWTLEKDESWVCLEFGIQARHSTVTAEVDSKVGTFLHEFFCMFFWSCIKLEMKIPRMKMSEPWSSQD